MDLFKSSNLYVPSFCMDFVYPFPSTEMPLLSIPLPIHGHKQTLTHIYIKLYDTYKFQLFLNSLMEPGTRE